MSSFKETTIADILKTGNVRLNLPEGTVPAIYGIRHGLQDFTILGPAKSKGRQILSQTTTGKQCVLSEVDILRYHV